MWDTFKKPQTILIASLSLLLLLLASSPIQPLAAATLPVAQAATESQVTHAVLSALCANNPVAQTDAGMPLSIEVQGTLAYVGEWATSLNGATNPGALHVFNVADPCSPQLLWSVPTTNLGNNELHDLAIRDGIAYLANDANGLARYTVARAIEPTLVDQRLNDGMYTHSIFYDGGRYAYVGQIYSPDHELAIYDMTTFPNAAPTYYAPTFSGHRDIHDVQVLNGRAYLIAADGYGANHFQILDVSTPTAPSLLGDLALPCSQYGDVGDIRVQGATAYVATGPGCYSGTHNGGLLAINVSTPASPQVQGSVFITDAGSVPYFGASLELSGNKAYVVTKNGLDVFDISNPANLTLQTPAPSYAFPAALGPALGGRVTIANNHAYVTVYRDTANSASKGGITVFNLGTTQCSAIPAVQTAAGTPLSIEVQGTLAYVGEWATSLNGATNPGALHVFNVADPCSPQLLWSTPTTVSGNNELHDLVVRDGVAYLANDSNGLVRYKVTEPAKPTFLDQQTGSSYTHSIFYNGGRYAYVGQSYATDKELAIYDMATFPNAVPTYYAPTFSGHRDIHDVQVLNGRAYLIAADGYGGNHFQILDVSTPTAPSLLGDLALPCSQYGDVGDIRIQGSVAYLATSTGCNSGTHDGGLLAINISTPASPQVQGSIFIADAGNVPYFGASLELSGSKAYVVTKNGLDVFDISNPANLTLQTPAPSYAFPATLGPALGGHVTIKDNRAYVTVYRDTANSASKGGMTVFDLDSTTPNPAPYRDVGKVRIWADSFQTVNGQTTASGNISIGPQSDLAYYRVGTTASWSGSGPLTVTGNLQIAEGPTFATGVFTVDTTSGALTWGAGSRATLSKLGDSNLAITPTITVNVLQPTMQVAATVTLNLPENTGKTLPVSYKVGVKGVISDGQPTNLSMKLAGGTLNATVTPTQQGLVAASAQYTLLGLASLTLPSVKIDAKGYAGLSIGSGDGFAMPNIDLGRGVFVLNGLQGSLMVSGSAYVINLSGGLSINHLPGMRTALTPAASNLRIAQGVVSGSVADFKLGIGGNVVNFTGVTIQHTTDYRLMAANAIWTWPAAWGGGTTTLKNVALTTTAPFIEISGSQGFTSDKVFALAGGTAAKITFDKVYATIAYAEKTAQWNVTINARVTFTFGSDSTSINAATFTLQDGVIRGSLGAQKLKIAGLTLTTSSLSFDTTAFKSDSASLQLPSTWGESVATLKDLTISASGITLGSSSNAFAIPDVTLGAAAMLKLSAVQGTLVMDKAGDYAIAVSAKLTINKVLSLNGDSLVVSANVTIKRGRVDGSVSNLAFKLSGVNISAASMTFIDNKLTAEQAKLTLPIAGSEVSTTIYGLELGGDAGLKLQSARVALPDFKIGTVGVRSVIIEFKTEADGSYGVIGAAKFAFTQFAVDGKFKIGYAASSGTALQSVTLDFKGAIPGTAIPLGNTGLYITKISGSFDLNDGSANITLQLGAASELAVGNTPVLEINGTVNIQIKPKFQLDSNANVKVIGIDVTNVQLQMTDTSFTLKGTAKISLIRASLELTFGKDASGQFTFYGNMKADVVVPKGYILNGRWIKIPAHDTTLASTTLEGGKFKQGSNVIWGARGSFKFLGVKIYTWAKLGPGDSEYGLGERLQSYTPVRPVSASMASAGLASAGDPYVVAVTKPAEYLMLAEEITTTNRLAPQDIMISGPQGVTFTRQLTYAENDGSARLYRLDFSNPQDAVGQWSLVTQVGNQLTMMGAAVPPQVQSFTACASTTSCLTPGQTLALSNGQNLALAWSASAATSGMTLDIYVQGTDGLHQLITHQDAGNALSLEGSTDWTIGLPSGSYTLTLQLEREGLAPVKVEQGVITISDTTAPAAPANFKVTADAAMALTATWDGTAAEADVAGYQVSVDGGEAMKVTGRLAQYVAYGLTPGAEHTISVAAYDMSGNLGGAATAKVKLSQLGVAAAWPFRDSVASDVQQVGASFSGSVKLIAMTVTDAQHAEVPGTITALTGETSVSQVVTRGATFTPSNGSLASGSYTATITAQDLVSGSTVTYSWSFNAIELRHMVYLPVIVR